MDRLGCAGTVLLLVLVSPCAIAQASLSAPGVSLRAEVAQAVAHYIGIKDEDAQVAANLQVLSLPAGRAESTNLRVVSARPGLTPHSWFLRLECASQRDCLPFEVLLRETDASLVAKLNAATLQRTSSSPRRLSPTTAVARSGERVKLVEELSGMRLTVKAVCLEAGGLGDRIHVRNLATRRVLLATVAAKGEVRVE